MKFRAGEIAQYLHGEVVGDYEVTVSTISKIEEGTAGSLAFLANPKYEHYLYDSDASIILVNRDFTPRNPYKATLIKVDDAYQAFASLLQLYAKTRSGMKTGIEQPSFMDESVVAGEEALFRGFCLCRQKCEDREKGKNLPPGIYR